MPRRITPLIRTVLCVRSDTLIPPVCCVAYTLQSGAHVRYAEDAGLVAGKLGGVHRAEPAAQIRLARLPCSNMGNMGRGTLRGTRGAGKRT